MDAVPVPVIDADGHVLETDAELEQYFEGAYKGHKRSGVFSIFPSIRETTASTCVCNSVTCCSVVSGGRM